MKRLIQWGICLMAAQAFAGDGSYEINAACSEVGCFTGDNPATRTVEIDPAQLGQGGLFRLSSDLEITNGNGIRVLSNGRITLDLNGYQIICVVSCTSGVLVDSGSDVEVRNGGIRSFRDGIIQFSGDDTVIVDGVYFSNMLDDAVQFGTGVVRNCVFDSNNFGINAINGSGVLIERNLFRERRDTTVQDAYFSVSREDACIHNMMTYGDATFNSPASLGSCNQLSDNHCNSQLCPQGERLSGDEESKPES